MQFYKVGPRGRQMGENGLSLGGHEAFVETPLVLEVRGVHGSQGHRQFIRPVGLWQTQ